MNKQSASPDSPQDPYFIYNDIFNFLPFTDLEILKLNSRELQIGDPIAVFHWNQAKLNDLLQININFSKNNLIQHILEHGGVDPIGNGNFFNFRSNIIFNLCKRFIIETNFCIYIFSHGRICRM